jgi:hypothetical protein
MNEGSKTSHLAGKPHAARLRANGSSERPHKEGPLHPNGKRRIPIHSVAKIHNHVCEIPLQAYEDAGVNLPRGRASMVTMEQVDAASDAWDARGILHDIDTQWGLMPQGGAYSDSDVYYGSGEYDFY